MACKISYKESVWRDLKRLGKDQAKRLMDKIDRELPERAQQCPMLHGEFSGLRKFRIGDYRVIFALMDEEALVLKIAGRKEVYR